MNINLKKIKNFNISSLLENSLFKWVVFPITFFLFGLIFLFTSLLLSKQLVSILSQNHREVEFKGLKQGIYAGEKIETEFEAEEDNLGIVAVRFDTFNRINDDQLIFRIKEKGQKDWYYENFYKTDQFQPSELFPFGFPIIPDSKGKTYVIEIESISGEEGKVVVVSEKEPKLQTRYQFSKEQLKNPSDSIGFLTKKTLEILPNPTFITLIILSFSPFFAYIFWLVFGPKIALRLKTTEDWFSVVLLTYLVLELITQVSKILDTFSNKDTFSSEFLYFPKKIFLGAVVILGVKLALKAEKKPSA